jgi:micrococcal nuclease
MRLRRALLINVQRYKTMLSWIFTSHLFTRRRTAKEPTHAETKRTLDSVNVDTCPYLGVPMDAVIECKVISVYDGDTITVILPFERNFYKSKIRVLGVDTPEIKTTNPDEKAAAIAARDWLRDQVLNKHVWLHCKGPDKYGRLLANLYHTKDIQTTESINDMLIRLGYAQRYDGGTKTKFSSGLTEKTRDTQQ